MMCVFGVSNYNIINYIYFTRRESRRMIIIIVFEFRTCIDITNGVTTAQYTHVRLVYKYNIMRIVYIYRISYVYIIIISRPTIIIRNYSWETY